LSLLPETGMDGSEVEFAVLLSKQELQEAMQRN
jgi:hypothetical protein